MTPLKSTLVLIILHFNSHAHVERDYPPKYQGLLSCISTHTLTWSVTGWQWRTSLYKIHFNSHAHVERDCKEITSCWRTDNFNSHAHVERDIQTKTENLDLKISTHTLTWSVTWQLSSQWLHCQISTHTLTWSVTKCSVILLTSSVFQLTRSRGAWQTSSFYDGENKNFNSHAHVERDRQEMKKLYMNLHFNSHAHVERDLSSGQFNSTVYISTHTLTWSVTYLTKYFCSLLRNFNSHAHVERDFWK